MTRSFRVLLPVLLTAFLPQVAWACPTCGLSQSFTPLVFLISLGFVIMPAGFAAYIGWRVWRDEKAARALQNTASDTESRS